MAKTSVVERQKKRVKLYEKYRPVREQLKTVIYSMEATPEEKLEAQFKIQKLSRNSSRIRHRNRCRVCGRPRAYNRLTGLCRLHMRSAVMSGLVPGMHKASW